MICGGSEERISGKAPFLSQIILGNHSGRAILSWGAGGLISGVKRSGGLATTTHRFITSTFATGVWLIEGDHQVYYSLQRRRRACIRDDAPANFDIGHAVSYFDECWATKVGLGTVCKNSK